MWLFYAYVYVAEDDSTRKIEFHRQHYDNLISSSYNDEDEETEAFCGNNLISYTLRVYLWHRYRHHVASLLLNQNIYSAFIGENEVIRCRRYAHHIHLAVVANAVETMM